ncbi:MAG: ABC transporter permease, partial [Bryobacter sp.]|nr:ABC transporter permease [Bryobacter sp.]
MGTEAALGAFGPIEHLLPIQAMLTDLRYAIRTLRRTPGYAVAVCLVLALGIGANTALFTVVHRVLVEPLPFPEPDRLVEVRERPGGGGPNAISWPNYLDWAEQQRSFENLAFAVVAPRLLPRAEGTELAPVAYVTENFFDTYRVRPAIGRVFSDGESAAVLDHGYWKEHYGGDPAVLGKSIRVGDLSASIIGVLPEFPWHREAKIYVSVRHAIGPFMLDRRENHNSSSVTGRLKPSVSLDQAKADLSAIAARLRAVHPIANRDIGIYAVPLQEWVTGGSRRTLLALFGAVAILLLLACVNVANMALARSMGKAREFTVRLALGASSSAIVRQIMAECLVLGVGGALAGLVLSRLLLPALAALAPSSLASRADQMNLPVFGFAALACLGVTAFFGVAPVWAVSRLELHAGLRERSAAGRTGHGRLRGALVVSQVALALVLLAGAGLLLRSLTRLIGEDPGFRTGQVVAVKVSLPEGGDDLARLAMRFA